MYKCPRGDLGCTEVFQTTGDLDWHCHQAHGYRHTWRLVSSFGREIKLPIGPTPNRRVPDGLETGPGTPAMGGVLGSATAAEVARAKHRGRGKEKASARETSKAREGAYAQETARAQGKVPAQETTRQAPEKEKVPAGGRARHRPAEGGRRAAKAGRGKHAASS
jgi:hypothetical protein